MSDTSPNLSWSSQLIGLVLSGEALSAELEVESSQPMQSYKSKQDCCYKEEQKTVKPEGKKERRRD